MKLSRRVAPIRREFEMKSGFSVVWSGAVVICVLTAVWSARCFADQSILRVEAVTDELMYQVDPVQPVSLLLSKTNYPLEDGHLDAIVWLGPRVGDVPGTPEVIELEPGDLAGFSVSGAIAPAFAAGPDRWFLPAGIAPSIPQP